MLEDLEAHASIFVGLNTHVRLRLQSENIFKLNISNLPSSFSPCQELTPPAGRGSRCTRR